MSRISAAVSAANRFFLAFASLVWALAFFAVSYAAYSAFTASDYAKDASHSAGSLTVSSASWNKIVDNIVDLDSRVTTNAAQLPKAWVNFDGTSCPTTCTIRAGYNVSSVTRSWVGKYTVNFTNAMADTNYLTLISGRKNDTNDDGNFLASAGNTTRLPSTASVPISTSYVSLTAQDFPQINVVVYR